jgi:hypothetical protein
MERELKRRCTHTEPRNSRNVLRCSSRITVGNGRGREAGNGIQYAISFAAPPHSG